MSIMANSYERQLLNALQNHMSKREAESALYDIRYEMYGDSYISIRPEKVVDNKGNISEKYPTIKSIVWAYFNDGFEKIGYPIFEEEVD